MNDYGTLIDSNTVRFQRLLPASVERVWSFLVDPVKRARWLAAGETSAEQGGPVELIFENARLSSRVDEAPAEKYRDMPDRISVAGTVTCYEPPCKLAYTWEGEGEYSEVSFELCAEGEKTVLTIVHRRLENREMVLSASAGWHVHLDILLDVLNEQEPEGFWRQHNAMEQYYDANF